MSLQRKVSPRLAPERICKYGIRVQTPAFLSAAKWRDGRLLQREFFFVEHKSAARFPQCFFDQLAPHRAEIRTLQIPRIKVNMIKMVGVNFDPRPYRSCMLRPAPVKQCVKFLAWRKTGIEVFFPLATFKSGIPADNLLLLSVRQRLFARIQKRRPDEHFRRNIGWKSVAHCGIHDDDRNFHRGRSAERRRLSELHLDANAALHPSRVMNSFPVMTPVAHVTVLARRAPPRPNAALPFSVGIL